MRFLKGSSALTKRCKPDVTAAAKTEAISMGVMADRPARCGQPGLVSGLADTAIHSLVRGPQLAELETFLTIAQLGSISGAARALQVSQPALSKRLRTLEGLLGAKLFERSTRGVTITPAGARLVHPARRLLDRADAFGSLILEARSLAPPVRLAVSPTVSESWLAPALVDVEELPTSHLSVEVIAANSILVRRMVRVGQSDLGLAALDHVTPLRDELTEVAIWRDEIVVAVPAGHPWASRAEIEAEEFAHTPTISRDPEASSTRMVDSMLASHGLVRVNSIAELGSTAAAIGTAIAKGVPVVLPRACVPESTTGQLVIRRVSGIRLERQFGLLFPGELDDLPLRVRLLAKHLVAWAEARL